MQSGLYYGYLGFVDGLLELLPEMGENCKVQTSENSKRIVQPHAELVDLI